MIPTPENMRKYYAKKRAEKKKALKVHTKVSNTFIENAIQKSNLSALKTIYYLASILSEDDIKNIKDNKIIDIKIDKREMLKYTGLSAPTLAKTTKQLQQTSITFIDKDGGIEGMALLPRYFFVPNKNIIEIDLYVRIAKLIIEVKKNYTRINTKDLMQISKAHTLRLLALLNRISQYDKDIPKRKKMTLHELNAFFGVNYKKWNMIEKEILKPAKEELDKKSKISFIYEANYEVLGRGRPGFKDVSIDVVIKD